MTDDYTDESPDQDSTNTGEKTFTQAQLDKIIANRLPEYDSLKSKADQFDQLTQSTEDALAAAKKEADEARAELSWQAVVMQRERMAAAKGLDPKLWSRVKGETKEEIEADIEELVGFAAPPAAATRRSAGGFTSGASNGKQLTDKERAAQELRGILHR